MKVKDKIRKYLARQMVNGNYDVEKMVNKIDGFYEPYITNLHIAINNYQNTIERMKD